MPGRQGANLQAGKSRQLWALALMLATAHSQAVEPRIDLTVCADRSVDSFRVIEVSYKSMRPVPCFTYLSSERRSEGAASEVTEQVAWARRAPGVCERAAQQIQSRLERKGYHCVTHRENPTLVRERIAAQAAPPIVLNLVGRRRVSAMPTPRVFVEAEYAQNTAIAKGEQRALFEPVAADPQLAPVVLAANADLRDVADLRDTQRTRLTAIP